MTILEFLLLVLAVVFFGGLAQAIASYSHGGCLVCIVLGRIRAMLATWIARLGGVGKILTIQVGSQLFPSFARLTVLRFL